MKTLLALALLALCAAPARAFDLTIVHTNDIHGWIMPRPARDDAKRMVGGAAALTAFYKAQPQPRLLLDAGDWFQGTPEGTLSRGQVSVDIFNAVPWDAVVIGNHDFDMAEPRLKELVAQLKMPVLDSNIYDEKTGQRVPYVTPWIVREINGVKVGLFGLTTTNMRNLTFPENFQGLEFRGEIKAARQAVKALKKAGATVIIQIDHVGYEEPTMAKYTGEQTIARKVPGIDLIVGGHSHTFLKTPYVDAKNGTMIVQDGSYLSHAGLATLTIDEKTKKVVSKKGELVELDLAKYGEDPAVKAIVDSETAKVSAVYDVVIATSQAFLKRSRDGESSLGDWMTDCEREWAGADLAIQNAGGIRADLRQGPVTLRDIFSIMPFDNYMVKLEMDGRLVGDMLDHGVDKTKGLVQQSGAVLAFDRDARAGERLCSVDIGGKPLDGAKRYQVATIDFLVKGGDGYTPFGRAEKKDMTRVLLRDVLAQCARRQQSIPEPTGGRLHAQECKR